MLKIFLECATVAEAEACSTYLNSLRGAATPNAMPAPTAMPAPQPVGMPAPTAMPAPQPVGMPAPTAMPTPAPQPVGMPAPQMPAPQPAGMPAPKPAGMPAPQQPAAQQITAEHIQQAIGHFVNKYSAAHLLGWLQQNFGVSAGRDIPQHEYQRAYNGLMQA